MLVSGCRVRVLNALLVIVAGFCVGAVFAAGAWAACGAASATRDYAAPLRQLPRIREVPESGRLPFGPSRLTLKAPSRPIIAGSGSIAFELHDEAFDQKRKLDWIVETELSQVNRHGTVIKKRGVRRRSIGSASVLEVGEFKRWIAGKPGFYRLDIRFISRSSHRLLGSYGTYIRLMELRFGAKVAVDSRSVHPGELVRASFTNTGTATLLSRDYLFGFHVQAFTGTHWIRVPENPHRPPFPARGGKWPLAGGMTMSRCLQYLVPEDQSPGLFRFVSFGLPELDQVPAATFEVLAR